MYERDDKSMFVVCNASFEIVTIQTDRRGVNLLYFYSKRLCFRNFLYQNWVKVAIILVMSIRRLWKIDRSKIKFSSFVGLCWTTIMCWFLGVQKKNFRKNSTFYFLSHISGRTNVDLKKDKLGFSIATYLQRTRTSHRRYKC